MAAQGIGSAVVLNLLLWVGLLVSILSGQYNPLYATAALVGVLLRLLDGGGAADAGRARAAGVTRAVARRIPLLDEENVYRLVLRLAARLQTLVADRRRLVRGLLWDLGFWLCSAASLWVFLLAFGYRAGVDGLIVAFGLAYVLAAIPITPAGLGVVEATMIALLTFFGADRGIATLGVVSYRLINFWLPIPLGALAYLSLQVEQETPRAAAGSTSAAGRPSCAAWPNGPCASRRSTASAWAAGSPIRALTGPAPRPVHSRRPAPWRARTPGAAAVLEAAGKAHPDPRSPRRPARPPSSSVPRSSGEASCCR